MLFLCGTATGEGFGGNRLWIFLDRCRGFQRRLSGKRCPGVKGFEEGFDLFPCTPGLGVFGLPGQTPGEGGEFPSEQCHDIRRMTR
jgi:hypothetical protein